MALRKTAVAAVVYEVVRLSKVDLMRRLHVSDSFIHKREIAGNFPKRHYIGERAMWFLHEIEGWEREQMARSPKSLSRAREMNDAHAAAKKRSAR